MRGQAWFYNKPRKGGRYAENVLRGVHESPGGGARQPAVFSRAEVGRIFPCDHLTENIRFGLVDLAYVLKVGGADFAVNFKGAFAVAESRLRAAHPRIVMAEYARVLLIAARIGRNLAEVQVIFLVGGLQKHDAVLCIEIFFNAVKRGITAMKWDPFGKSYLQISNKDLDTALECVAKVREAVGNGVDLLIEGHGRFDVPTGIKIAKELEQFKPMWFEEPVPPNNIEALKAVRDKSPVAISAGERLYTRFDYNPLFAARAADYIQPDVSHAGGIMELKKIAAIAEANYIPFAPHNPSGPVANAATLQLAACCPNFCILEIMYSDVDYRKFVTDERLVYENGRIKIGDKPGMGIELNEEECLKHPYAEHNLRHYTGALTDIRPPKTEFYF